MQNLILISTVVALLFFLSIFWSKRSEFLLLPFLSHLRDDLNRLIFSFSMVVLELELELC